MAPRLKVFRYADGFHSWTVAAPSRAKALQAWGMERDLFKDGAAQEIDSGPDHAAALKAPGELIERGLSVDVGKVTHGAARKAKTSAADDRARARVAALEGELDDLDRTQAEEVEALEARRVELDAEAADLARRQSKARDALKVQLKAARAKLA